MNKNQQVLKCIRSQASLLAVSFLMGGLLTSCESDEFASGRTGHLSLSLQADTNYPAGMTISQAKSVTRAGVFGDFNPEDYNAYEVEILSNGEIAKSFAYGEMPDNVELREGSYQLKACLGHLFPAAFEQPYFCGTQDFSISDGQTTPISVTTKLANTKVDVAFSEIFAETFEDYKMAFATSFTGRDSLNFSKGESRSMYFQSDKTGTNLGLTLYVKPKGKSWLKTEKTTVIKPQEYVHFNFKTATEDLMGKLDVEVTIDSTTIDTTLTLTLSNMYLPLDAPSIQVNQSTVTTHEGVAQDVNATIAAPGFIKNCYLYVNSAKLIQEGWKSVYDLSALTDQDAATLRMKGLSWNNIQATSTLGTVEFDNLIANLTLEGESAETYQFALVTTDPFPISGKSDSTLIDITVNAPVFNISMSGADAWATKATLKAVASAGMGNTDKITGFKYKVNGGAETYIAATHQNGVASAQIAGLTASTDYSVYAIYGVHHSGSASFATENPLQVENANMETWSEYTRKISNGASLINNKTVTAYYPYESNDNNYWTCVNQKTFESSPNITSSYNLVPSMKKVDGRSGYAALIRTVGWDNYWGNASGTLRHVAAGKLFMGNYSFTHRDGPETYDYGQAFTSRPTSVSAYFKYAPYNGDSFKVWAVVENRDNGTVTRLGYGELTSDETLSEFTQKTFQITYTNTSLKATHFYLVFSSSANCSDDEGTETTNLKSMVSNGSVDGYTHYEGSNLTIDDIQINY